MQSPHPTRRRVLALGTAALATAIARPSSAQSPWPNKPIKIVVAYSPGGDTDVLARVIGEKLSARVHQPVIVENRTGASGMIGTSFVAHSPPDGYTLLFAPNTVAITPLVLKNAGSTMYNPVSELTSIVQIASQSLFIVVNTQTGVSSVDGLVAAIKAGRIDSYASPGYGTPMHILAELFAKSAGVRLTQVPFQGSAPAVPALVSGQVPLMFTTLGPVDAFIRSGKLRILGVADPKRSPLQPDVPTLQELGYKGAEVGAWQAMLGPAQMPERLVGELNGHLNDILRLPEIRNRMSAMFVVPAGGDAASMSRLMADDYRRYGHIVEEFNIHAE